jgi:hypothetical protein
MKRDIGADALLNENLVLNASFAIAALDISSGLPGARVSRSAGSTLRDERQLDL